jgi:hypothetical protein
MVVVVTTLVWSGCYQTSDPKIEERQTSGSTAADEVKWPDGTPVKPECISAADCLAGLGACEEAMCVQGKCAKRNAVPGAQCSTSGLVLGDCQVGICQASGNQMACVAGMAPDGFGCGTFYASCGGAGQCWSGVCADPCHDQKQCNVGTCTASGCTFEAAYPGAKCDDGDPCTSGEACYIGICDGGTNICECKTDADCQLLDDNLCDGLLKCQNGKCVDRPGTKVTCEPTGHEPCAVVSCVSATGECETTLADDGTVCDDDDPLTFDDQCVRGSCLGSTEPPDCCDVMAFGDILVLSGLTLSGDSGVGALLVGINYLEGTNELLTGTVMDVVTGIGSLLLNLVDSTDESLEVPVFYGDLDSEAGTCNFTTDACSFVVGKNNFDLDTCKGRYLLTGELVGSVLSAQADRLDVAATYKETSFAFALEDIMLTATLTGTAGSYTGMTGTLAAQVPLADVEALVDHLDDQYLEGIAGSLNIPVASARQQLKQILQAIADEDGNIAGVFNVTFTPGSISTCFGR